MRLANIFNLGVKELRSLRRDPVMVVLIIYSFTLAVFIATRALPETLHNAPIAIVDEDHSVLSSRIVDAFYPPLFNPPALINWSEMDAGMDSGRYTFALDIPPDFERDVLARHHPRIQLNIDATRMTQAFTGNWYVQTIVNGEVSTFVQIHRLAARPAGQARSAGQIQPQPLQALVRRGHGVNQPDYPTRHCAHRRRPDPGTGAWHH